MGLFGLFRTSKRAKTQIEGTAKVADLKPQQNLKVWICACGRENPNYVSTCVCGASKWNEERGDGNLQASACNNMFKGHDITSTDRYSKENAFGILREMIKKKIENSPADRYELTKIYWDAAAKCFPDYCKWDLAIFYLDFNTMGLCAEAFTYPTHYGYDERKYRLTAEEFHQKAKDCNMASELQHIETDADWDAVLDDGLKEVIADSLTLFNKEQEKKKQLERLESAIVIPDCFFDKIPLNNINEMFLELNQGESYVYTITLAQKAEKYILSFQYTQNLVVEKDISRELTLAEAVWLEQQVSECIENPNQELWQDARGSSKMTVKIFMPNSDIVLIKQTPMQKYYALNHQLQRLAKYGSISEMEK